MTRPNPHIALIYHYDLARALNGEPVDWVAIPVNVDAGREGGDLCRAAADFARRRDLFAMPAPTLDQAVTGTFVVPNDLASKSAVPADPNPVVELQLILACVRRVETEVGSGWHPDDGPEPLI